MKIDMIKLPVKDLVQGYEEDDSTSRVRAWGGKLDVRPEYQREYVYGEGKRDAVINTVLQGFPLNIMYFVDRKDGTYVLLTTKGFVLCDKNGRPEYFGGIIIRDTEE